MFTLFRQLVLPFAQAPAIEDPILDLYADEIDASERELVITAIVRRRQHDVTPCPSCATGSIHWTPDRTFGTCDHCAETWDGDPYHGQLQDRRYADVPAWRRRPLPAKDYTSSIREGGF